MASTWDFFIAHAGGDTEIAEALYRHLHSQARTFLDSKCLKPGDDWSVELARAQQASRVTVVLVSRNSESAYYQREEIAAAIDAARRRPAEHRVVPVYLEASGIERSAVPYGLRIRHGIVLQSSENPESTAQRLLELLRSPEAAPVAHGGPWHASVTGFAGRTERGPAEGYAVRVDSFEQFVALFGSPVDPALSFLGYAVRGFFENGGGEAFVARVLPPDAATALVLIPDADGRPCLRVSSRSPGAWGNSLTIEVTEGARAGIRLTVVGTDAGTGRRLELEDYDNLGLEAVGPNYLPAVVSQRSKSIVAGWAGVIDRAPAQGGWVLAGGSDGGPVNAADFGGGPGRTDSPRALEALAAIPDIALVCVPDYSHPLLPPAEREELLNAILAHCREGGDRLAILAPGPAQADTRAPCDSVQGVMYAPWIRVPAATGAQTLLVPPVGHVAGAFARLDAKQGVAAPPAGLAIEGLAASGAGAGSLEFEFDNALADRLRRRGVNALRTGADGKAVLGSADTMALDSRLQPVQLQRQVGFLRRTLTLGTQWMVFEVNDEETRKRLVDQITEFLGVLWRQGMLFGGTAADAYFVHCDDTTMTREDYANHRLICQIGLVLDDPRVSLLLTLSCADLGASCDVRIQ